VRRATTALVALLAVFALGAAAGGFDAPGGPELEGDWRPTTITDGESPDGVPAERPLRTRSAPPTPSGEDGGAYVDSEPDGTVASAGSEGVSPLFVAVFVGGLLASGLLALALTGDDDRAPAPPESPDPTDPRPTVEVRYGTPPDSPVVRAWERVATAVDAAPTETPGETARRAADADLSRSTVDRLAAAFEAVRYGSASADDPTQDRAVTDATRELDSRERDA
jgi:hypothetical protein